MSKFFIIILTILFSVCFLYRMVDEVVPNKSPTVFVGETSQQVNEDIDLPNDLFKKMVINNGQQNKRLSKNLDSKSSKTSVNVRFRYGNSKTKDQNDSEKSENSNCIDVKLRFVICTLGIAALTMCQMSRMVLNLSITSMVDPSVLNTGLEISEDGSCPWPDQQESIESNEVTQQPTTTLIDGILFYLTTEEEDQRIYDTTSTDVDVDTTDIMTDRFMWSMQDQNVLLGGFFYSYFFLMVLGGRMAEIYGSKYVLFLSVAGSSVINLATPWLAKYSFTSLVVSRILLGVVQAGVVPGIYALFSQWLTMTETGIYTSLIKVFFCMGMVLGSLVFGFFSRWEDVFYCTGCIGTLWCIVWLFIATSSPTENNWISEAELQHIMKKKRKSPPPANLQNIEMDEKTSSSDNPKQVQEKKTQVEPKATPWIEILTNPSVIGFVLVKLSYNYLLDFITIELPSYLKYVHHASNQTISFIHTAFTLMQATLVVFVGWGAQSLIKKRAFNLPKTVWRKIFEAFSSYAVGVALILLTFNNCSIVYVGVVLQFISLLSMFNVGGDAVLPYDLSDEYPATIAAIGNSIANLSGITTTVIAGQILGNQGGSYDRWNLLIRLIGIVNILGGLAFTILVSAKPIIFKRASISKEVEASPVAVTVWSTSTDSNQTSTPVETTSKILTKN